MLPVNLNEIKAVHIRQLIEAEVAETLTLEYKQELPGGQSEEKREFLYDVAALANAAGGDLVFGIRDRRGEDNRSTGVAESLSQMRLPNAQQEIIRLSNLIRDSIAPRLTGIGMVSVNCPDGDVLVIRVPKSWNRPHMVTIGGVNKFFGRVGTTKYLMSVEEIGRSFSEQRELRESIDRWRSGRADLVGRGEGPAKLVGDVTMLFHAIPSGAFSRDVLRESWTVPDSERDYMHVPHGATSFRYNADGFLCLASSGATSDAFGYTQLFRSGIVEYADGHCFGAPLSGFGPMIFGQELEKQMVNCYKDAVNRFRRQGRNDGIYVGFSLIGIANKSLFATFNDLPFQKESVIRKDIFTSPEVFVDINDAESAPYAQTLLPLVDTMWQVGGRQCTPFKPNGEWKPFGRYQ